MKSKVSRKRSSRRTPEQKSRGRTKIAAPDDRSQGRRVLPLVRAGEQDLPRGDAERCPYRTVQPRPRLPTGWARLPWQDVTGAPRPAFSSRCHPLSLAARACKKLALTVHDQTTGQQCTFWFDQASCGISIYSPP